MLVLSMMSAPRRRGYRRNEVPSGGIIVELNRSSEKSSVKIGEDLTDNQKMILKILSKKPSTSARQLSDSIGISA